MFELDESEQKLFLDLLTDKIYRQLEGCHEFIEEWAILANELEVNLGREQTLWELEEYHEVIR